MATTEYTKILYDEAIRCIEQTMIFCNVKEALLNYHNLQKDLHGIPWNVLLFGGLLDKRTKVNRWSKFRDLNLERPFTIVRNVLNRYGYELVNKTNDNLYPIILVMISNDLFIEEQTEELENECPFDFVNIYIPVTSASLTETYHLNYVQWLRKTKKSAQTEVERNAIQATLEYSKILFDEARTKIDQRMLFYGYPSANLNSNLLMVDLYGYHWNVLLFGGKYDRYTKMNDWREFRHLNLERPFTFVRSILHQKGFDLLNMTNDNPKPIIEVKFLESKETEK